MQNTKPIKVADVLLDWVRLPKVDISAFAARIALELARRLTGLTTIASDF